MTIPLLRASARCRVLPAGLAAMVIGAWLCLSTALAVNFPALNGHIVDQANVIPQAERKTIESKLVELEAKSGIQLVVASVSSLDGEKVDPYAKELFRHWQLGEKVKNKGVLLVVAPNQRQVRIEVGSALEGTLNHALRSVIIRNALAPHFRAGDFAGGISRGVDDIITVLTTDASDWHKQPSLRLDSRPEHHPWYLIVLAGILGIGGLFVRIYLYRFMRARVYGQPPSYAAGRGFYWSRGTRYPGGGLFGGGGGASGRW